MSSADQSSIQNSSSEDNDDDDKIAKCIRKVSNFSNMKPTFQLDNEAFNPNYMNLIIDEASPKLVALLKKIENLDKKDLKTSGKLYKHFIYSDVLTPAFGAKLIASALIAKKYNPAFTSILTLKDDNVLLETKNNNFGLLMSKSVYGKNISNNYKKQLLLKYNSRPENVHGELVRFIILDSGYNAGIDLFDVKYVHLFEPLAVRADEKQSIGRATRFCGQKGLEFHPKHGWPLYVFRYDIKFEHPIEDANTIFELYLKHSNIDLTKIIFAAELEETVIEASVDNSLTKELHTYKVTHPPPILKSIHDGGSLKEINEDVYKKFKEYKYEKVKLENKCNDPFTPTVNFSPTQDFIRNYFKPELKQKGMLLYHSVGSGKCHAIDTPILMYDGSIKKVQDIVIGEKIMGDDSKPRNVLSLGRGIDDMYDIIDIYNNKYTVNSEHILCLYDVINKKYIEIEVKDYLKLLNKNSLKGYRTGVEFSEKILKIDPWVIGNWLINENFDPCDEFIEFLNNNNLINNKHIPDIYKFNNKENRLALLEGMLEKDYIIKTKYEKLNNDIIYLIRSLGFGVYIDDNKINILYDKLIDIKEVYLNKKDNYYGFTLDGNHKYLLGDFTVTHNTCTAIATATTGFEDYTILWVTRHTLKTDIWKNMFKQICHMKFIEEKRKFPSKIAAPMRYLNKNWIEPMSYKQFSNMLLKKNKYYNTIIEKNGIEDPLKKTLLIIDEAHKLYTEIGPKAEKPNMDIFEKMIDNSYEKSGKNSVRILLMTATPYTEDPMEMIKLLNLLRKDKLEIEFEDFKLKYLDRDGYFKRTGKKIFQDRIAGYISYVNRSQDARNFAHPIIEPVIVELLNTKDHAPTKELDIEIKELAKTIKEQKEILKNEKEDCKKHKKECQEDFKNELNELKQIKKECKKDKDCKDKYDNMINNHKENKTESINKCIEENCKELITAEKVVKELLEFKKEKREIIKDVMVVNKNLNKEVQELKGNILELREKKAKLVDNKKGIRKEFLKNKEKLKTDENNKDLLNEQKLLKEKTKAINLEIKSFMKKYAKVKGNILDNNNNKKLNRVKIGRASLPDSSVLTMLNKKCKINI
jgi:hypothetical protein